MTTEDDSIGACLRRIQALQVCFGWSAVGVLYVIVGLADHMYAAAWFGAAWTAGWMIVALVISHRPLR